MREKSGPRVLRLFGIMVVAALVPVTVGPAGFVAAAGGQYELTAAADGLTAAVLPENFEDTFPGLVSLATPSAQTSVNSLGDSHGFASNPYPGQSVVSAPALVRGTIGSETGQQVPIPDYPAYAASRHPAAPDSVVEQPGYSLSAHSTETSSDAKASTGVTNEGAAVGRLAAAAASKVDQQTGAGSATAESDIEWVSFNDVLKLSRVHSTAGVSVSPSGRLKRTSSLTIAETTVNGMRVAITPRGLEVPGQTTPLSPADEAADVLRQAGIEVRYLAPEKGKGSMLSAGIEVSVAVVDPTTSTRVATVRYVLGRAFASAHAASDAPTGPGLTPPPPVGGDPTPSGGAAGTGNATPSLAAPAAADAPPSGEAAPTPAEPPAVAAPELSRFAVPVDLGATGIYLTLVLGALAIFVGGTLVRLLGVRTRWTS